MRTIIVQEDQSLMDIALQEYGSVEAVQWIVEDNPGTIDSIVENLYYGMLLNIRDEVMDGSVKQALQGKKIATMDNTTHAEGIGFERIEIDMKVH